MKIFSKFLGGGPWRLEVVFVDAKWINAIYDNVCLFGR